MKAEGKSLQQQIDEADLYDTIEIAAGKYKENITIDKPVHLLGSEDVEITSKRDAPVITVVSDKVVLENMQVTHDVADTDIPAVSVESDANELKQLNIHSKNVGIELNEAHENQLSSLQIIGDENVLIKERQHGIELQKAHENEIHDARVKHVKDGVYIENSKETYLHHNRFTNSRYGTHLMFAENSKLEKNEAYDNVSGLYIMGTNGTEVTNNTLINNRKSVQSMGLFLFDSVNATVKDNNLTKNRIGMLVESATDNEIAHNHIQGNYTGVQLKKSEENTVKHNTFVANVAQGEAKESASNTTNENYWGDHRGLDITGDGLSNIPYKVDPFFLNMTEEFPPFQLLFQAPGMMFLDQLIAAPPEEQLVDEAPLMETPDKPLNSSEKKAIFVVLSCLILMFISVSIIYMGVRTNEKI
ncbi:MAG TPA: right-handed parallel beta-helix repeat-containing protein [Virgibacillus sp.]|nr:right-handed parallel beta-helix repeat-containing protein [Virgibacillus sp.]